MNLGIFYLIGVALASMLLIYEHSLIKEGDLSKINAAFLMPMHISV